MNRPLEKPDQAQGRWALIRDVAVFQVKLVVDGIRDVILVPVSLIAGMISLLSGPTGKNGMKFYQLLGFGKHTEEWINLFGAEQNLPDKVEQPFAEASLDELVGKFESYLVDEVQRGGVTAQAKDRLDRLVDALQRKKRRP